MTTDEFIQDAQQRIVSIGLTVGYVHLYVDGTAYVASYEGVPGCYGHPFAEAQQFEDGRCSYSLNIRTMTT